MSDSQKEQRLGPQRPKPVFECKTRNDSVLATFSKKQPPPPTQKNK